MIQAHKFARPLMVLAAVTLAGFLAGCGGGSGGNSDEVTVNTNGNGSLATVGFAPDPGSFINRSATFVAGWPNGHQPPSQFSAALHRYVEGRGNRSRSDSTQKIEVLSLGGNEWNIKRRDNFELDQDGVYYLRLSSPGGLQARSAYIVSGTRALTTGRSSRDIPTGGHGSLANVQIDPPPGSVFIPRDTTFDVFWPSGSEAPPRLGIDIWRYEESGGTDDTPRKVSDQSISLDVIADAKEYRVRIKNSDSNQLAAGGVYFVEITGPGEVRDYAYIVSSD